MTRFKMLLTAAALASPIAVVATAADAQAGGVAVANVEAAVANSKAMTTARQQIQATYKTQIDQANTRRTALEAELRPLADAYQKAAAAPGATEASLRPQAQAIQTRQQAANNELGRLLQPAQRATLYAEEQVAAKLNDAVQAAVRARGVTLLLRPEAAMLAQPAADITPAITAELDRSVPTVSIAAPAGWQPGQRTATAPAAAPAQTPRKPQGR